MRRTCLLIVLGSVLLALTAGATPAIDSGSGIVFTDCPPALRGGHCDSMFYQIVAIDLSTGKQCPEMKYILVDGPGEIDEKTGLWQFHPEKEVLPQRWADTVEIAASKGDDTTTSDENCRFAVIVSDHSPLLVGGDYQQLRVSVGDTLTVPLVLTDEDWCDEPRVDSVRLADPASGLFSYDSESQIVTFVPDSADAGKHFDVYITVSSGSVTRHFTLHISVAATLPTYVVRAGFIDDQIQGQYCEVPITLEKFDPQWGMSGFDFLVGFDASALSFQLANEGELYEECGWEYFTYRYGAEGNCDSACPSGLLRIIGIAETNNGAHHPNPGCAMTNPGWVNTVPTTLAQLRFLVSNDRTMEGAFLPIRFFWADCGDNVISDGNGSRVFLSYSVHEFGGGNIADAEPFPTYRGAQDECVIEDPALNRYALRAVDYFNGGIQIIAADSVDAPGDINLNGIPYEIADAVMFSNYFTHGLAAFGAHIDGSVAASDVTKDGLTLSIADLVYLIQVIVGDALPYDLLPPSPNVAAFTWTRGINEVVSFNTPDTLGAICLVAQGEFTPYLLAGQMEMKYALDSGVTRILVWSLDGHAMTSGNVLAIPGATGIVSIETATHDGRMVSTSLEIIDEPTPAPYAVRIGSAHDYPPGSYLDIPITLLRFDSTQGLGGFDFLLGYSASQLAFQLAFEGDLYDECSWEYFTYRFGTEGNCTTCPSGMLRIVGLAETNNGDIHPGCDSNNVGYVDSAPVTLANLRFLISNDVRLVDTWIPLSFLWVDCGDNVLSSFDGSDLYLSSGVFDVGDQLISGVEAFPTYKGAQDECVYENPTNGRRAVRRVDFFNGGVNVFRPDSLRCDGDLNSNGLPYEVADAMILTNYFHLVYEGPGSPETELCIDVNQDGQNSIADYVWLPLVIIGDILPDPAPPSPNPAAFVWDKSSGVMSVSTLDTLGAVYMFVEGEVAPIALSGEHSVSTTSNGLTRILIYSGAGTTIMSGSVEGIPGATGIVEIQAATHDGRAVTTSLEIIPEDTSAVYAVRIGSEYTFEQGVDVTLPITLEPSDQVSGLGGFHLLIGYDANALAVLEIAAGSLYDSCGWEYFTYRIGADGDCGDACPTGLIHLVGLVDYPDGPQTGGAGGTGCSSNGPITLARVTFRTSTDSTLADTFLPVRFFWQACSDNMFANTAGTESHISAAVYDRYGDAYVLISGVEPFPTYKGAQAECVVENPTTGHGTARRVDFFNGGVFQTHYDPTDAIGDVNLNGIAFELADLAMFRSYFVNGPAAFGDHISESIAATDINRDGEPLTVEDFQFLFGVNIGWLYPLQTIEPSPNPATAYWNSASGELYFDTPDSLGVAFLQVAGEITPVLYDDDLDMIYQCAFGYTKIFLHAPHWRGFIKPGTVLGIAGATGIGKAKAATYDARAAAVAIVDLNPSSIGDINLNGYCFEIADAVMFSNYFVYGISAFIDDPVRSTANADIDRDGVPLELQDLVFFLRILEGGMQPADRPYQSVSPYPAYFTLDPASGDVYVRTEETIGAVVLTVRGDLEAGALARDAIVAASSDSVSTILLGGIGSCYSEGLLVSLPGATELLAVQAAACNSRPMVALLDPTYVRPDDEGMPTEYSLHGNYPNPFNPITTIAYDLPERADVTLTVYNVVGQKVRTLVDRTEGAGRHEVFWDGRDESGEPVSSGIYLYRITAGDFTQSRKMLLLK